MGFTIKTLICVACLAVTACSGFTGLLPDFTSDKPFDPSKATTPFDGAWRGNFVLTLGENGCPKKGLAVIVIQDGKLSGQLRYTARDERRLYATISEDGQLKDGNFDGAIRGDVKFTGEFSNEEGKGRYLGDRCAGTWEFFRK